MDKAAGAVLSDQYLLTYDHDMKNEVQKSARAVDNVSGPSRPKESGYS
jgi:hypothetical protein